MGPIWSDAASGGTLGEGHDMQDGPKGGSRRGVIARNGRADICDANVELGVCALDHLWACCKECGILFVFVFADTVTCKTEQGRVDGHRHEAGGVDAECEELPVALCRISVVPLADNLGRKMPFSSLS